MKKIIISVFLIVTLMGCTGMNVSTTANLATDTAFVLALQNNPTYKTGVLIALQEIKSMLANEMTYDQLIALVASKFTGKNAVFGIILAGYLAEDKPVFETYINMLDSYKADVIKKIDRFILLANSM
jgi:hypothetical protein